MDQFLLKATLRKEVGKKVNRMRAEGKLPAVIYGRHIQGTPIWLETRSAVKVLKKMTASSLVKIDLDGDMHTALVRERQYDPVLSNLLHVDFQALSLTEKVRTAVSVQLVGVSPSVEEFNATIVTGLEQIEVEALPNDLPDRIEVDLSSLLKIGDGVYVRDLNLPASVEVLVDENEMLALSTSTIIIEEEEEEVEEIETEGAEPEVLERGKKEEEESEE